jgi:predicted amidohydrolase
VPLESRDFFARVTRDHPIVIVAGQEYNSQRQNCALVAVAGNVIEQPKIVRSPFDLPDICVGDTINVFRNTRVGDFAVLVCSDLASPEIIEKLKGNLDLLITVERNKAVNAYAHLAFTAAYEIGCYVLLANDSIHGPSLLAMPRKRERDRLRWLTVDELEKISYMSLKLRDLRKKAGEFLRT